MSAKARHAEGSSPIADRLKNLPRGDWMAYREAAARYEAAWSGATPPPTIDDFLPSPSCEPMRSLLLIHLIKEEYEQRWGQGENFAIGRYFERFPELYPDRVAREELLAWEAKLRGSSSVMTAVRPLPSLPKGFRLVRELARGGMSRLFLIEDANGGTAVLKQIDPSRCGNTADLKRFENEIVLARDLAAKGVGVVPVFLAGEIDGQLYYTMPFCAGGSLRDRLVARRPQPLSPPDAAALVVALARIVQKLQEEQPSIVHRDIKPENILFLAEASNWNEPLIADLGLAKVLGQDGLTGSGAALGTWIYMSPEQVREPRAIDGRADVYALGVILYECLTGRLPFSGTTPLEIIHRIYHETPIDPSKLVESVPEPLNKVVRKCLEKESGHRYATARELADDLGRFLAGEPVQARRPGRVAKVRAWARWNPKEALAYAAAFGALVIGLVISVWSAIIAVKNAQSAESQAQIARREARRADDNASLINDALGRLVVRIGQDRRMQGAGITTFRNELLRDAVAMYSELAKSNPGQGTLGLGQALNNQTLLQYLLGDFSHAVESARRADVILSSLPRTFEARLALANTRKQLGVLGFSDGKLDEGLEQTKGAVVLYQSLVRERPDDQDVRFQLALATVNLGNFAMSRDPEGAIARYREALGLLAALQEEASSSPRIAEWQALTTSNLGLMLAQTGKPDAAIETQREAVAAAEQVTDEFLRVNALATCRNNLGEALEHADRPAEAEPVFRRALEDYQKVSARFPNDVNYRWDVAMVLTNLAAVIVAQDRHNEARKLIEESKKIFDDLAGKLGTNDEFQQHLTKHARVNEAIRKFQSSKSRQQPIR